MIIYLVTNDVNNYRAMRKYGWSHFRFQVIDSAASQVELDEKERFYIDKYNSISCGYNMVEGGRANPMSSAVVRDKHLCDRIKQSSKEHKYIRGLLWVYCV